MELTVHNTDPSDNVEKLQGEKQRGRSVSEAWARPKTEISAQTKFPLLQDLLSGSKQFFNSILKSLPRSGSKLLY